VFDAELGLNTYRSIGSVSRADLSRLALDGRTRTGLPEFRTGEGLAAGEFENAFGVRFERISKETWPSKNPPDYRIFGGELDGKTVDFLYTADSRYAVEKMNDNFLRNARAERSTLENIIKHTNKADYVPMDLRTLNSVNQQKLLNLIQKLTPDQRGQLLIIRQELPWLDQYLYLTRKALSLTVVVLALDTIQPSFLRLLKVFELNLKSRLRNA